MSEGIIEQQWSTMHSLQTQKTFYLILLSFTALNLSMTAQSYGLEIKQDRVELAMFSRITNHVQVKFLP